MNTDKSVNKHRSMPCGAPFSPAMSFGVLISTNPEGDKGRGEMEKREGREGEKGGGHKSFL
jgi:hypothetical protein